MYAEAGQSLVIAVTILTMNLFEIINGGDAGNPILFNLSHSIYHHLTSSLHHCRHWLAYVENHLFSSLVMIPFIGVTLGLLKYNW